MLTKTKADLYRCAGNTTLKSLLHRLYADPGFKFLFYFRLSQKYARKSPLGLIYYIIYRKFSVKYGFQIPRSVKVGEGLALPHFGGIVINSSAQIGKNCNILQGVTIGNIKDGKKKGSPVVGNNVYLGPNSVVVGNITIGDNVLIVANSFVNFNVPDNSIVIGNPGKIISKEYPSKPYLHNSINI